MRSTAIEALAVDAETTAPACRECSKPVETEGALCTDCHDYARRVAGDQLAGRLTVSELVAAYELAEKDIRDGFALVAQAEKRINSAFALDGSTDLRVRGARNEWVNWSSPDDTIAELRRSVWHLLIDRLEIRRMMSITAWEKLEKDLRHGEVPEITSTTVSAMARQFSSRLSEMLEEAIVEVFNYLRPPNSRYKTNTELEIRSRVVLSYAVEMGYSWVKNSGMRVRYHEQPRLTALENVFTALDGKGSITKTHYSALSEAINKTQRGDIGETEYFRFRGFKNGSLHLEFKRLDLLDKFNRIAGGARLRPKGKTE